MNKRIARTRLRAWLLLAGLLAAGTTTPLAALETPAMAQDPVQAAAAPREQRNVAEHTISVEDLGYDEGLTFEGSQSSHAHTFFFPLPRDVRYKAATLRLHYRSATMLHPQSNMRVLVNNIPRQTLALPTKSAAQWVDVPITAHDLKPGHLRITVKSALLVSDNRCFDERVNASYVTVLPDSRLHLQLDGAPDSVRGYWALLPKEVRISLPSGALSPEVFASAWSLGSLLMREGKEVTYTELPDIGHIVLAPRQRILATLEPQARPAPADAEQAPNAWLFQGPRGVALALSEPLDSVPFYLLSDHWRSLAAAGQYRLDPAAAPKHPTDEQYALRLAKLGLDTGVREISERGDWGLALAPQQLPPGYRPDRLHLTVLSAPSTTSTPVMFYVYLNGALQQIEQLNDDGQRQYLSIALPADQLRRHNHLRFVAQRDRQAGDCGANLSTYPVQILPDSALSLRRYADEPQTFAELAFHLGAGFSSYLPKSMLTRARSALPQAARLSADMYLPVNPRAVHWYDDTDLVQPTGPFLVFGRANLPASEAAVRFDRGKVEVRDHYDNLLFRTDQLPKITIAQVARSDGHYGLWIAPGRADELAKLSDLHLSDDNVAFADATGTLLTLDRRQPGLARIQYPDLRTWFTIMDEYRYWIFGLVWLALTVLVLYLYRRVRQHSST